MPDAPMKPIEAWAHVRKDTGEVTFICELDGTEDPAAWRSWSVGPTERLARVVITEKEAPQ